MRPRDKHAVQNEKRFATPKDSGDQDLYTVNNDDSGDDDDAVNFVALEHTEEEMEQTLSVPVIVLSARHLLLRPGSGEPVGAVYRT